jgi:hypothetical protein
MEKSIIKQIMEDETLKATINTLKNEDQEYVKSMLEETFKDLDDSLRILLEKVKSVE